MNDDLAQKAIKAALECNWKSAIKLNEQLLKDEKNDVDSLNRLARAYSEIGKIKKAIETSKKVLMLDSFNKIATSCLEKWKNKKEGSVGVSGNNYSPKLFIEESGKTKLVSLINLTNKRIIASLRCAEKLVMNLSGHRVSITTIDGKYVGRLPDDVGLKLKKLSQMGNEYTIHVKSNADGKVIVFIRQIKTSKELEDFVTFPSENVTLSAFGNSQPKP